MLNKQSILQNLIEKTVNALGYDFWGFEKKIQKKTIVFTIYIETLRTDIQKITIGDCSKVSRHLSSVLDVEGVIKEEYVLEVSSPGLDRKIFKTKQFEMFIGKKVCVKLIECFENKKKIEGVILAIENDSLVINIGEEEVLLPFESIQTAKLIPIFE